MLHRAITHALHLLLFGTVDEREIDAHLRSAFEAAGIPVDNRNEN